MFAVLWRGVASKAPVLDPRALPRSKLHQRPSQPLPVSLPVPIHSRTFTMKSEETVVQEFNELVNMNAEELAEWLKGDASIGSGWKKDDGSGETVGHDRRPPYCRHSTKESKQRPDRDDIAHMRKVVSYCKRHLAQVPAQERWGRAKQNANYR